MREAYLKPAFASLYPPLTPGVWVPAADVGRRLLAWAVAAAEPINLGSRLLRDDHFEFRGGEERARTTSVRTRASDSEDTAYAR